MTAAQEQEWSQLRIGDRWGAFLAKADEIRRRRRIDPKEYDRLFARSCVGIRTGSPGAFAFRPPPDEEPVFAGERRHIVNPAGQWLAYRRQITAADLRELRKVLGVAPSWDRVLRQFLLTGEMATLPFQTVGIRVVSRGGRYDRLFLEVFRDSSIGHIVDAWPRIESMIDRLRLAKTSPVVSVPGGRLIRIRIGKDATLSKMKRLWSQRIVRVIGTLEGRPRFRTKKCLARDKTYHLKRSRGLSVVEAAEATHLLHRMPGEFSDPATFCQANYRLRSRLK